MIDGLTTILLCFDMFGGRKCRSLTRRNDDALDVISDFAFDSEFEIDRIAIPESEHDHYRAAMANYQGYPLILGGGYNELEMFNIVENTPSWIEGTAYPYSNT